MKDVGLKKNAIRRVNMDIEKIKKVYEELNRIKYFDSIEHKGLFAQKIYEIYKDIDIVKELKKMELWLDLNPKRRKKDYRRFIFNWLNRVYLGWKFREIIEKEKVKKFEPDKSKEV